MTAVVCIDDKNGMMFNKRRQSRDSILIDDLMSLCSGKVLHMCEYSRSLFENYQEKISVDENFPESAGKHDICFIENADLSSYAERIDKLIIYRWNRHYPSDLKLTLDLSEYKLQNRTEFKGSSHDKITREEYIK